MFAGTHGPVDRIQNLLATGAIAAAVAGAAAAVVGADYASGMGMSALAAILAGCLVFLPFVSITFMLLLWAGSIRKRPRG